MIIRDKSEEVGNYILFNSCNITGDLKLGNSYEIKLNEDEILENPLDYVGKRLVEIGSYEQLENALLGDECVAVMSAITESRCEKVSLSILQHIISGDLCDALVELKDYLDKYVTHRIL